MPMTKIKVNPDNYFVVQGWMITDLNLKGNALMIYAIIYGFSQTTNTAFTGSVDYLCEWLGGISRPTVINTLDNLVQQGLLTKSSTTKGALIYNSYTAVITSKKILPATSKKILHNNNSINNIEKSLPKGKEEQAPKKSYNDIFGAKENEHIKDALVKFVSVCKARNIKFQYKTLERWAKILRENAGTDSKIAEAMVNQSIDNGWKDIYSLKKRDSQKQTAVYKPFNPETDTLAKDQNGNLIVY